MILKQRKYSSPRFHTIGQPSNCTVRLAVGICFRIPLVQCKENSVETRVQFNTKMSIASITYSQNSKVKKFHHEKIWSIIKGFDREIISFQE